MTHLTDKQKDLLTGYANALQDLMLELTGENHCAKRYDPIDFSEGKIHSYAFDMKDGGRHHPLSDYKDVDEIKDVMLKEVSKSIKEDGLLFE
jgi:hypothetical protein